MSTQNLYIPEGCSTLESVQETQIRLCIQSPPGGGKTWSALTFPNPIVANFDRGLGAHVGRKDVIDVPFYDEVFVNKLKAKSGLSCPPNRRDAFKLWLSKEGGKLSNNQTLVIDSLTNLQNAFDVQQRLEPVYTAKGALDAFAPYKAKLEYFGEITESIKMLKCHVVLVCHETKDRDEKGELNGKVRPLLSGQFSDQLASHFTDYFRQLAIKKPTTEDEINKFNYPFFNTNKETVLKKWCTSTPTEVDTIYLWQTKQDNIADCKSSSLFNAPKFMPANYTVFNEYKRIIK